MKINLCKIFGVEEGEEFKINHEKCREFIYKVKDNCLKVRFDDKKDWWYADFSLNRINEIAGITKLPKKKEFGDDELFLFKKVNKEYEWCARDKNGTLYLYEKKPYKKGDIWYHDISESFNCYNHLFNSILWEDEEPVYIPDYVER